MLAPKCQFFKVSTSSCLREVVNTLMSLERGLLNLCLLHSGEQKERDRRLRHSHSSGCINTFPDCDYP